MSFAEKISGLMARPNQQQDDKPWYFKYGVRFLGITGGFFFILFGLMNALYIIVFKVGCLIGGILQVLTGFIVLALEAPCCFFCLDYVNQFADMADARPVWYRAVLYIIIAVIPLFLCAGITDIFASVLIFGTGVAYGMMGLGKKASADAMRQAAVNSGLSNSSGQPTTNDRAGIVNNAQPFSFTGAVGTDSNV